MSFSRSAMAPNMGIDTEFSSQHASIVNSEPAPAASIGKPDGRSGTQLNRTRKAQAPPLEPWRKLTRAEIVRELAEAQSVTDGLVPCAGCRRELEAESMELDHIVPRSHRSENDISNRILLCRPCNGRKSARLTMKGLIGETRKAGWMKDESLAGHARDRAQERYEDVRYRRRWPAVTSDLFD